MMDQALGVETFLTRVETWECDFNGHWNTRFYLKAYERAVEVLESYNAARTPRTVGRRFHVRFHKELHDGAAVAVRSGLVKGGAHDGEVVHFLYSRGKIVSTALVAGSRVPNAVLPAIAAETIGFALPRGLAPATHWGPAALDNPGTLGLLQPSDLAADGWLGLEHLMRLAGIASHHYMWGIGYSSDFTARTGIGRMLAELRVTEVAPAALGLRITSATRQLADAGKTLQLAHALSTQKGDLLATLELVMLAVDLKTRRATRLPDFLDGLPAAPFSGDRV